MFVSRVNGTTMLYEYESRACRRRPEIFPLCSPALSSTHEYVYKCTHTHTLFVHVIIYQLQRRIKNVFSFYKPLPMRDVIGVMTLYASILSARLIAGLIPGDITKRQ